MSKKSWGGLEFSGEEDAYVMHHSDLYSLLIIPKDYASSSPGRMETKVLVIIATFTLVTCRST